MKKLLLLLVIASLSFLSYSQGKIIWKDLENKKIDTIEVNRHAQETEMTLEALIVNTVATDYYVALKRTIVSYAGTTSGSEPSDQLCYGTDCQFGTATKSLILTGPALQAGNATVSTIDPTPMIHYVPKENLETTILKYYILTGDKGRTVVQGNDTITRDSLINQTIQDSLVVKYIVEPYVRVNINMVVDMTGVTGFDPTIHSVYAQVFDNGVGLGSSKMDKTSNTYVKKKAYEVDGNLSNYTYKYYYGIKDIPTQEYDTIGEPTVRGVFAVTDADRNFDDNFGVFITSVKTKTQANFSVYPNPFNESITLTNLDNATRIEITNILGQTVYTTSSVLNSMVIPTSDLTKGMYFVRVTGNNNKVFTERIVKK